MKRVAVVAAMVLGATALAEVSQTRVFNDAGVEPPYDAKEAFAETFDARALEVIRNAKHVEVFRLANDARWEGGTAAGDGGVDSLDGFAVSRRFVLTDSMLVARVKTLTLNPAAYRWYNRKPSNSISVKMCGGFQRRSRSASAMTRWRRSTCFSASTVKTSRCASSARRRTARRTASSLTWR